MTSIRDMILISRIGATSTVEKTADALLKPARVLFGGKRIYVINPKSVHVEKEQTSTLRRIACVAALPLTLLGLALKLSCRNDQSLVKFYATPFAKESTCSPALSEMVRHVHLTKEYVIDSKKKGQLLFKPLDLYECSCVGTGAFHRFKSPRRNNLENAFVQKLVDTIPDKNQKISLLSLGSGGMMSDLITLEKLVLAGFKNISLDGVDPYDHREERAEKINAFFQKYPECQIEVHTYKVLKDAPPVPQGYTAIMAMDCDELTEFSLAGTLHCLKELMDGYQRLAENGFVGLGFAESDLLFRFDQKPEFLYNNGCLKEIVSDLTSQLPDQEELSLYFDGGAVLEAGILLLLSLKWACLEAGRNYKEIKIVFKEPAYPHQKTKFQDVCARAQQLFPGAKVDYKERQEDDRFDLLLSGIGLDTTKDDQYFNMLNPKAPAYLLAGDVLIRKNEDRRKRRGVNVLPGRSLRFKAASLFV